MSVTQTRHDSPTPSATSARSTALVPGVGGRRPGSATGPPRRAVDARAPRRNYHPWRVAALIAATGLFVTGVSAWTAAHIDRNTEQSLLQGQTKQAAAVLSTAVTTIQQPIDAALAVQRAPAARRDPAPFKEVMAAYVGKGKTFETASLWRRNGKSFERVATLGPRPATPPTSPETLAQLRRAFASKVTTVRVVAVGQRVELVYVRADPTSGSAVYAERALPADRRAPVDKNSAFSQLHYAIYFGRTEAISELATTDVDPARLPFDGVTAREAIPFGDGFLTLATTPREHLGSDLGRELPWLLLVAGLVLTAFATGAGQQLARGRQAAEHDAATITELYERTEVLFDQQRELFMSLQRALLPQAIPHIPNLELAAQYVAGARGLDIGGDWYSIIELDDSRFGFVVGDVSGRGVDAVAVMANARFTIRAYLMDGVDPAGILEKCAPQFDILADGHMTTALVGVGDWRTGEVTLASAGHPPPALVTDAGVRLVDLPPGRPLGTGVQRYPSTQVTMPPGSTLFCFTDGLVERRGESIDEGLARLTGVLDEETGRPVDDLVAHTVRQLRHQDAPDDIAALAIRWTGAR
jgi:serine phosphatase RsbU (regulator of sigma subunit)